MTDMTPTLTELKAQRDALDAQIAEAEKQAQREANGGFKVGDRVVVEGEIIRVSSPLNERWPLTVRLSDGYRDFFNASQLRHATPEPVAQEPVGWVNIYPSSRDRFCWDSKEKAKEEACPDAIRIAQPVYLAPQPPPDTVSREKYDKLAEINRRDIADYIDLKDRYDALREKYDALRKERYEEKKQAEKPAYWRYMMPDFSHGMASDRDSIPHDATIVEPVYRCVTHLANCPTAVTPKGVIPFVENLEQLLRVEKRDALAEQVAKLRNCIVELPEAENLVVDCFGWADTHPRGAGYVDTPAEALQIAANAVKAAALLAAAEQKEGDHD